MLEGKRSRGLGDTWVGGNDIDEEGTWKWTDGSPFEFTFWYSRQPTNAGGNEHCLELHAGAGNMWNDRPCSRSMPFLCSKKKSSGRRRDKHGFIIREGINKKNIFRTS